MKNKNKTEQPKKGKKELSSVSVQRWPVFFFISSSYSIRKENPNPCSILQCHLWKSGPLSPMGGGETMAEARTRRKSLYRCSPLRRGKKASLGKRKPNRAIVRRIQAGRFCIWCLTNCGRTRKYIIRQSITNHNSENWKLTSQPLICHSKALWTVVNSVLKPWPTTLVVSTTLACV